MHTLVSMACSSGAGAVAGGLACVSKTLTPPMGKGIRSPRIEATRLVPHGQGGLGLCLQVAQGSHGSAVYIIESDAETLNTAPELLTPPYGSDWADAYNDSDSTSVTGLLLEESGHGQPVGTAAATGMQEQPLDARRKSNGHASTSASSGSSSNGSNGNGNSGNGGRSNGSSLRSGVHGRNSSPPSLQPPQGAHAPDVHQAVEQPCSSCTPGNGASGALAPADRAAVAAGRAAAAPAALQQRVAASSPDPPARIGAAATPSTATGTFPWASQSQSRPHDQLQPVSLGPAMNLANAGAALLQDMLLVASSGQSLMPRDGLAAGRWAARSSKLTSDAGAALGQLQDLSSGLTGSRMAGQLQTHTGQRRQSRARVLQQQAASASLLPSLQVLTPMLPPSSRAGSLPTPFTLEGARSSGSHSLESSTQQLQQPEAHLAESNAQLVAMLDKLGSIRTEMLATLPTVKQEPQQSTSKRARARLKRDKAGTDASSKQEGELAVIRLQDKAAAMTKASAKVPAVQTAPPQAGQAAAGIAGQQQQQPGSMPQAHLAAAVPIAPASEEADALAAKHKRRQKRKERKRLEARRLLGKRPQVAMPADVRQHWQDLLSAEGGVAEVAGGANSWPQLATLYSITWRDMDASGHAALLKRLSQIVLAAAETSSSSGSTSTSTAAAAPAAAVAASSADAPGNSLGAGIGVTASSSVKASSTANAANSLRLPKQRQQFRQLCSSVLSNLRYVVPELTGAECADVIMSLARLRDVTRPRLVLSVLLYSMQHMYVPLCSPLPSQSATAAAGSSVGPGHVNGNESTGSTTGFQAGQGSGASSSNGLGTLVTRLAGGTENGSSSSSSSSISKQPTSALDDGRALTGQPSLVGSGHSLASGAALGTATASSTAASSPSSMSWYQGPNAGWDPRLPTRGLHEHVLPAAQPLPPTKTFDASQQPEQDPMLAVNDALGAGGLPGFGRESAWALGGANAPGRMQPLDYSKMIFHLGTLHEQARLEHNRKLFAPPAWRERFWAATQPLMHACSGADVALMLQGVVALKMQPPTAWIHEAYAVLGPRLASLSTQELCISLYAATRLPVKPPAAWLESALEVAARRFDADFDAPAFALTAHALGRLRYRPSRPWVTAFLESSQGLLYDFRLTEFSLLLRGLAFLGVLPPDEWLDELFLRSEAALRIRSIPAAQAANMAWSLAMLKLLPPRKWVGSFLQLLDKRVPANALGPYHAQRALSALAAFGVKDWPRWAHRMGVSPKDVLPPEARQEHARSLEGASPTGEVLLGSGVLSPMAAGLSSSMAADLSPSSAAAVGTSAVQAPKAPPKKRKTVSELSTNRQLGIVKSMARRMATAASAAVIAEESGDEFGYSSSMDSDSEQAVRAAVMIKQVLPSDLRWGGAAGGGDAGSGSSSSIGAMSGNRVLGAVSGVEGLGQRSVFSTYDPSLGETSSEGEDEVIGVEVGSRSSQLQALAAAAEARAAELAGQLKAAKAKAKAYRRSKAKALAH